MSYKVAFVTGSRADYGIVRKYLQYLQEDKEIDFSVLVTGALLDDTFGRQVNLIYQDGFKVETEIKIPIDTKANSKVVHAMAVALDKFGDYFGEKQYDLLIILGDRYEMLSVAIAAAMHRIPILHLHGGEATYGNYDEFIRHAITKMSSFHFTATEEYRKRVIQLGENPDNVFYLGALGAENCLDIHEENVSSKIKELPYKKYFVVLFHPETLTQISTLQQVNNLLNALANYSQYTFVFLGTNADTNSNVIRERVATFVKENRNTVYYENLHSDAYHYLLKNAVCLIGNSSSGIIEAPSLGIYTINIGDRQKGRVRGKSVIDIACTTTAIKDAIESVILNGENTFENPYYLKNSAVLYYEQTKKILENLQCNGITLKKFYDISF